MSKDEYIISGKRKYPFVPSYRFVVLTLMFIGCASRQASNNIMNFSIACMVNASSYLTNSDSDFGSNSTIHENKTGCAAMVSSAHDQNEYGGTYDWDRSIQSNVLAALSMGSVLLIFAGGYVCDRFGVKIIYVTVMVLLTITSFLIPTVAPYSWVGVFVLRLMQGSAMVVGWPAILVVANEWFADSEHPLVQALAASGSQFGAVVSMAISGPLCQTSVGWPATFYLFGTVAFIVSIAWLAFYFDNVNTCPCISVAERDFILATRKSGKGKDNGKSGQNRSVPWRSVLSSPAVWAIIVINFGSCYTFFLIGQFAPTYYKEVLAISPDQSGIYTAMPFAIQLLGRAVAYFAIRGNRRYHCLSETAFVRIMGALVGCGQAVSVSLATLFDCYTPGGAVFCFGIAYFFFGMNTAAYIRSSAEIAPEFTGSITGMSQTSMFAAGVLAPYITGWLTPHSTPSEWKIALYVSGAVSLIGGIVFGAFASGVRQPWADIPTSFQQTGDIATIDKMSNNKVQPFPDRSIIEKAKAARMELDRRYSDI